eukprot:3803773-Rhodomonas_salina.2
MSCLASSCSPPYASSVPHTMLVHRVVLHPSPVSHTPCHHTLAQYRTLRTTIPYLSTTAHTRAQYRTARSTIRTLSSFRSFRFAISAFMIATPGTDNGQRQYQAPA